MFRKILAVLLVAAALPTATSVIPGLVENVAYAQCQNGGEGC